MSKKSIKKLKDISEPINKFDEIFLQSKDLALQPITFFIESDCDLKELPTKSNHLSLSHKNHYNRKKSSQRSKKSKKSEKSEKSRKSSQKSLKSQKSTSNTNKKSATRKRSFNNDSNIYSSNIVIVYNDDDCSSTDPIEKEIQKFKRMMSKNQKKKKKGDK